MPDEGWQILIGIGKETARKQRLKLLSGANIQWGGDSPKGHKPALWYFADWQS